MDEGEFALLAAAAALVLSAALGLVMRFPDFPQDDLAPLYGTTTYDLAMEVTALNGPIRISVEYQIAETDIPVFLDIIAQRRRIRIRDGARRWALSRDLHHPEIWVETYQVPTWLAYQLHNARRTKADAEVTQKLRGLHKGANPPKVTRLLTQKTGMGWRRQNIDYALSKKILDNTK